MEVRVLGPVGVWLRDESLPLGGVKQRSVLAILVANAGKPVSAGMLVEGVYGEEPSGGARRTIQTYVANLRRELGDVIVGAAEGYTLDPARVEVDAIRFEALFREGTELVEPSPEDAARMLAEGLALWRGHAYSDAETHALLSPEIVRLDEMRLAAIEGRIEAELALGLHQRLLGELEALTIEHPLRERLRAQHMLALYRSGRQSEALRAFGRTREYLGAELGIEPSPELQGLEDRILRQDPGLDVATRSSIERRAVLAVEAGPRLRRAGVQELDIALRRRNELLAQWAGEHEGTVLDLRGSAVYAAFPSTGKAIEVARALTDGSNQLAIDFGDIEVRDDETSGPPITLALRLAAVGHPSQILLSEAAQASLLSEGGSGWSVAALGPQSIRGLDRPIGVFQLAGTGLAADFPPLRLDELPPPLPLGVRQSLPGYELREELGGGAIGVVHRAYHSSIGREVAIRVVRPELIDDPRFIRRFEAESQRIAAIEHPHVVPLLDYWREPGHAFMVYRLLRGGPLAIERRRKSEIMSLLEQIAGGVTAGHARGIPHGRIHPHNVLLDEEGYVYLADLGIAAMFEGMARSPADAYTAPEQIGGRLSVAADVYALGVLASELLSGDVVSLDGPLPTSGGPTDAVVEKATHHEAQQRFGSVDELVDALAAAMRVGVTTRSAVPGMRELRNPFKGLSAFRSVDAADFFGRDETVDRIVDAVRIRSFVLVAGPSGIGKSSVVRAGLVPRLQADEGWLVTDMLPGARPFEALETALERLAARSPSEDIEYLRSGRQRLFDVVARLVPGDWPVVLVVDQFEELFTHTVDEATRRRFLDMLGEVASAPSSRLHVVATIRADLLDRPLQYGAFGRLLDGATVPVAAPVADELVAMIRGPARNVGLDVDDALVEVMVGDAEGRPGSLPLLQHTLTELFEMRENGRLTLETYRASGGLLGAIGRRADSIYAGLLESDRAVARNVLLHLASVDDESEPTRRRVRRSELDRLSTDAGSVDRVVQAFGRHRLLVFDRDPITRTPTVEVAHEALLREWERLRAWIHEARADLIMARRLEVTAGEWAASGEESSYLLRGGQLERAVAWQHDSGLATSPSLERFIDTAVLREDEERAERRRRRQQLLVGFAAAAVIGVVLAVAAWVQRGRAQDEAHLARARELVLEADKSAEIDPELSIHLALRSIESFREIGAVPGSAVTALRQALAEDRVVARYPGGGFGASVSADGRLMTTRAEGGGIAVWDLASGELVETITETDRGPADAGWFIGDAQELMVGVAGDRLTLRVFDLEAGTWSDMPGPAEVEDAVVSRNGRYLALATDPCAADGSLCGPSGAVWDRQSGQELFSASVAVAPMSVSDQGILTYVPLGDDPFDDSTGIVVVDATSGEEILRIPGDPIPYVWGSVSRSGDSIAVATFDGRIALIDLESGDLVWAMDAGGRSWAPSWLSEDRLLVAGEGLMSIIDADAGVIIDRVAAHEGGSSGLAPIPGTSLVASSGFVDGETLIIDVSDGGPAEVGTLTAPFDVGEIGVGGDYLQLSGEDVHAVVDLSTGALAGPVEPGSFDNVRDNAHVSVVARDDGQSLFGLPDGPLLYSVPPGWEVVGLSHEGSMAVIHRVATESTRVVAIADGSVILELDAGSDVGAAFSPGNEYIVTGAGAGAPVDAIRLWRVSDGRRVNAFAGSGTDIPSAFVFEVSPNGGLLVAGGEDGIARLFDFGALIEGHDAQDALIREIPAHDNFMLRADFSPDGTMLLTQAWNDVTKLWDVESGALLGEFGPDEPTPVEFHPSQPHLLMAEGDTIQVLTLELDELVEIAQTRLSREMSEAECELYLRAPCDA